MSKRFTIIILSYLSFIVLGMSYGLLGLVWPSLQIEFQIPLSAQADILLPSTVASLIASFYTGALAQRFGFSRVLASALFILTVCLFVLSNAQTWLIFVVVVVLNGAGGSLLDAGMNTYVAQNYGNRAMNWLHAAFGVGFTLTPLLMQSIFSAELSWRYGYLVVSIAAAVILLAILLTRAWWSNPRTMRGSAVQHGMGTSIKATLRLPIIWLMMLFFFFTAGSETTPGNWIFSVYTDGRGIHEVVAAQWVSVYAASFTIGRIFFGFIINRVNPNKLLQVCIMGALVGAGMMWWNPTEWVGFAGLTLLGFAQAPIFPVMISLTPQRVGAAHATHAISFQVAGAGAGIALIPAFAGYVAEQVSLEAIIPIIFISIALMLGLYQGLLWMSKRRTDHPLVEATASAD